MAADASESCCGAAPEPTRSEECLRAPKAESKTREQVRKLGRRPYVATVTRVSWELQNYRRGISYLLCVASSRPRARHVAPRSRLRHLHLCLTPLAPAHAFIGRARTEGTGRRTGRSRCVGASSASPHGARGPNAWHADAVGGCTAPALARSARRFACGGAPCSITGGQHDGRCERAAAAEAGASPSCDRRWPLPPRDGAVRTQSRALAELAPQAPSAGLHRLPTRRCRFCMDILGNMGVPGLLCRHGRRRTERVLHDGRAPASTARAPTPAAAAAAALKRTHRPASCPAPPPPTPRSERAAATLRGSSASLARLGCTWPRARRAPCYGTRSSH